MAYAGVVKSHVVLFYHSSSGFYYFIVQVLVFIILSFKFWFLVVHGVCHLDFKDGNLHVKYLCAVEIFVINII